ncbi:MAG: hypothetical protein B7733_09915 [Myxococcales bacterium FL481]|nr:MAG: hypothetical protein B7733_09915 [Myxococcales bacterium FL481]
MRRRETVRLTGALVLAGGFVVACPSPKPTRSDRGKLSTASAPSSDPSRPIVIPVNTRITSLDPLEAEDRNARLVVAQLFDTLVDYGKATDELVPELAVSLPTFDAGTQELTFRLPTGEQAPQFSDDPCFANGMGRAVLASDVAYSLRRHEDVTRSSHGLLASRLDAAAGNFASAIESDDRAGTVRLRLRGPAPELVAMLANPQMAIVPRECVTYYDGQNRPAFREHPVGSGPFALDYAASEPGRRVVLVRHPPAGAGEAPPRRLRAAHDRVQIEYFRSAETALRLFQAGQLATLSPGQSQFTALFQGTQPRDPSLTVVRTPLLATTLLMFNQRAPWVGNHRDPQIAAKQRALREAIALAFDAGRYHTVLRNGAWAEPAVRLVPPRWAPADAPRHRHAPLQRDVVAARRALARFDPDPALELTLRYLTTDDENARQDAAILRHALAPLGIHLDVTHDPAYLAKLLARDPTYAQAHLFAVNFDADYPAAESWLGAFRCAEVLALLAGYCSADYDATFARLAGASTLERNRLVAALEQHLADAVVFRPIDHPHAWLVAQPGITGVERHPMAGLRIERLAWR